MTLLSHMHSGHLTLQTACKLYKKMKSIMRDVCFSSKDKVHSSGSGGKEFSDASVLSIS